MLYEQLASQIDLEDIGRARKADFYGLPAFVQFSASTALPHAKAPLKRFASISSAMEVELAKCKRHLLKEERADTVQSYRNLLDALTPGIIATLQLPALTWLALARLAILDFRFSLALELRSIAKITAKATYGTVPDHMQLMLRIALEDGNLPMLVGAAASQEDGEPPFLRHRYLYMGGPTPKGHLNEDMRAVISGKSVAIVGPVDNGLPSGEEIDSFDVVVRFNYSDPTIYQPDNFGRRTDVSYYAVEDIARLEGKDRSRLNDLKVIVVPPAGRSIPVWHDVTVPIVDRVGVDSKRTSPFILGVGAGLQRMLFDLLRYTPKRVKVFNANMFARKGAVPGYRAVSHNFHVWHEPFSNIIFTKRLLDTGRIEADELLSYALNLPLEDYALVLEKQFRQDFAG